jgi:hypothetical protein
MNMNTFPLALSKNLEGEGERLRGGGAEWLKILECEAVSLCGPAGQDSFTWPRAA